MSLIHDALKVPGAGVTLVADRWHDPTQSLRGTVILLHGGGQTRHSWASTARGVAHHGWTAIAIDARGHGDSDWAVDGDYSMEAAVADLRSVVEMLDVRPVLVGASLGGMTSLIAEGESPRLSRGLVLVDITPRVERLGSEEIQAFMRAGLAGFDSLEDVLDAVVAYNPHRKSRPRPDGLMKNLRMRDGRLYWHWDPRLIETGDEPTRGRPGDEDVYARARAAAANVTVPTLLVRGLNSKVVSTEGAMELLGLIPGSLLIEVPGAGHMVAGDDNAVFSGGLVAFLDRC